MSKAKKLFIGFLCLFLGAVTGCGHEGVQLETGETLQAETAVETVYETEIRMHEDDTETLIYVYVCGQVADPGVYPLEEDSRVFQAVEMAGGILPEGDPSSVNLAETIHDGQKIYIPSFEEAETWKETEVRQTNVSDERININLASKDMLMTLPGIGESKAEAIIAYRQEMGPFDSTEALMNVPGIKEGVYSKIKDRISIN